MKAERRMIVSIEGHAIVSADGMIAAADGTMPDALRCEADWMRFQRALDSAVLVVLGRKAHELFPNPGRRRLVLTRSVADLEREPGDVRVALWNPAALDFAGVLVRLGLSQGTIAIAGVFDVFVDTYIAFDLTEVPDLTIPGGQRCFRDGQPREVLARAGMRAGAPEVLDSARKIIQTR